MTLILTEIGPSGIAMAADTAVTERWGDHARVLYGVTKLFAHPGARAGLATWGEALLPNPVSEAYPVALEFALSQFLVMSAKVIDARELAARLADWLNNTFPRARNFAGVDVAAVIPADGGFEPVILRIANAPSVDLPPGLFRVQELRPPGPFDPINDAALVVAGDSNANVWIDEISMAIKRAAFRTYQPMPDNSLRARRGYLAVLTRSVSDIYATTGIGRTIGGPVLTLGIDSSAGKVSSVEPSEHGGLVTSGLRSS